MNKWMEILLGLILLLGSIVVAFSLNFWEIGTAAIEVFKGGLFWAVAGIGVLFLLLGISDLKE